jgi:hypothetical protein
MMLMQNSVPVWPDDDSREHYDRFINDTFVKYKGCMIVKVKDGYKWNQATHETLEGAKGAVDEAMVSLSDSMKRIDIFVYNKDGKETLLPDVYKSGYLTGQSPWEMYRDNQNQ